MPVRTHERHQASRGGLNGSDGSRWTLLAVRDEVRRQNVRMGENRRNRMGFSKGHRSAHHSRCTAGCRTKLALVSRASMVMAAIISVAMRCGFVVLKTMITSGCVLI